MRITSNLLIVVFVGMLIFGIVFNYNADIKLGTNLIMGGLIGIIAMSIYKRNKDKDNDDDDLKDFRHSERRK